MEIPITPFERLGLLLKHRNSIAPVRESESRVTIIKETGYQQELVVLDVENKLIESDGPYFLFDCLIKAGIMEEGTVEAFLSPGYALARIGSITEFNHVGWTNPNIVLDTDHAEAQFLLRQVVENLLEPKKYGL